ncbi:MAG: flagellar motor switch protein FliG [Leptospiraceae bacterium]|nr:MAG: flagellar motor switch protein FliG [Leptospiraceae bacterium]
MKNKQNKIDFTVGEEIIDNKEKINVINKNSLNKQGKEKAAKLLIALGPEQASLILKELSDDEIQILVEEMLKIKKISEKEKKEILKEFYNNLNNDETIFTTGKEEAKKILTKTFGNSPEKIEEFIKKAENRDLQKELQFIENYDPKIIISLLQNEHPQIIAAILSLLKPSFTAQLLKLFSPEMRREIIFRIAHSTQFFPEGIEKIIETLKVKLEKKANEIYSESGGIQTVVSILNHLDRKYEYEILEYLEHTDPDLYEKIKSRLYTFEELERLEFEELRILLSKIDAKIIATALLGMPEDFKRTFFNALSQNKASDVLFEMDVMNNVPVKKIQEARNYILKQAKLLDEEGSIIIKKDKEEFID